MQGIWFGGPLSLFPGADGLGLSEPTGLALLLSTSLEINFARGGVFS